MDNLINELEKLNLNEKEAILYLAALELREANIQQIAKKSGIKRTTAYDIIDSLKNKGLISKLVRGKKNIFSATSPHNLEEIIEQQKHTLKRILPELLTVANTLDSKPKIRFFEGQNGITDVYEDTLLYPDQELLAWVTDEALSKFNVSFLNEYYLSRRIEKKYGHAQSHLMLKLCVTIKKLTKNHCAKLAFLKLLFSLFE